MGVGRKAFQLGEQSVIYGTHSRRGGRVGGCVARARQRQKHIAEGIRPHSSVYKSPIPARLPARSQYVPNACSRQQAPRSRCPNTVPSQC